ncbi:MAG: HDIG domain-containing protein [Bacteroidetes bacterium]|nr:HDIG domain-containing protein [Bacteroidota bacterium]
MPKKIINSIRDKHEFIFKILIFLSAITLVVFLFPREGKFKYEYQKNKTWAHQDLYAPFDFAILKSQQEIEKEKHSIQNSHLLYFNRTLDLEKKSIDDFNLKLNTLFDENLANKLNKETYLNLGTKILYKIYDIGVYEPSQELNNIKANHPILLLNEQNIGEEFEFNDLLTKERAFTIIDNEFTPLDTALTSLIKNSLRVNIVYDKKLSDDQLINDLKNISSTRGGMVNGQKIITNGEFINEEKFLILESLKNDYENKLGSSTSFSWILIGQFIIVSILFYTLFIFLKNVSGKIFYENKDIVFLVMVMVGFLLMTILVLTPMGIGATLNVYLVPFCSLPILIRTFFGNRIALFVYVITIFIISFMVPNSFEFVLIEIIAGIITLFTILNVNKRSELFYTALIIFASYSLTYVGFSIIQEGNISTINLKSLSWFAISAGLTVFSYNFVYVLEKMYGYISDVTLLELSDTNNKLLRELNLKAPGTFQHSLQVANLAEEASREIGGNPLLVRTGALYHDIGKMLAPAYFIENQSSGVNPHDDLSYEESASIIISHVINGIEIAKKHQLPEQIIDFIRTHHGTLKTQYFLRMFAADNPDFNIEDKMFQYPGPIPFTKETAILMMADSVEAASRSLKKYNLETITDLVNSILDAQVNENQFNNTDITFKDITIVKRLFIKKLMNIYHVRVEYPK